MPAAGPGHPAGPVGRRPRSPPWVRSCPPVSAPPSPAPGCPRLAPPRLRPPRPPRAPAAAARAPAPMGRWAGRSQGVAPGGNSRHGSLS